MESVHTNGGRCIWNRLVLEGVGSVAQHDDGEGAAVLDEAFGYVGDVARWVVGCGVPCEKSLHPALGVVVAAQGEHRVVIHRPFVVWVVVDDRLRKLVGTGLY